ncbi:MAG: hypothetical protein HY721_08190 [Planctomycetes bacterium]|nr:hypothetical protein [Planctomycetota bacterium]
MTADNKTPLVLLLAALLAPLLAPSLARAQPQAPEKPLRYYAHPAAVDGQGVIAPWYRGQNGQLDLRVRVAAETVKRYPWAVPPKAVRPAPEYVYNGTWAIAADGTISVPALRDWDNGDLGQRAAYVLAGLVDYYRYSGDAAAVAHISVLADTLIEHFCTGPEHPWPGILVSCPTRGKPYGKCDPHGLIQLDIVAEVGLALARAWQLAGEPRWLEVLKGWGDLFAKHCNTSPLEPPWRRYANPADAGWSDVQTGGVVFILELLEELIRIGHAGEGGSLVKARDAGRAYLRDVLLPRWTVNDVWGRNYWDWEDPVQAENVTELAVRHLLERPEVFPLWRTDGRNVLSLFLNRTSVAPESRGDVYSGAWAYPESSGCCGRSLWYGPLELAPVYLEYGARAGSEWGRELGRRQAILATYDVHETGVVEDNIDGGQVVAGGWFKIAHPMALKHALAAIAWLPEVFGPARENHIVRSSSVVSRVEYGRGKVAYRTFDAPPEAADVLRLAFRPERVLGGKPLPLREDLREPGYVLKDLPGGDCLVTIRHDGERDVVVEGRDPQEEAGVEALSFSGEWREERGEVVERVARARGAAVSLAFTGNQVRLLGSVGPEGGTADVYLDGAKQLVPIDCWSPSARRRQVLFYRNGLAPGRHELRVEARGARNPVSRGDELRVSAVQWSAAEGSSGSGEGGGPRDAQRVICGYPGREDYRDSKGQSWRPATEVVVRLGTMKDSVTESWWTERRGAEFVRTPDPELYRHGMHARDFTAYFTVGPGTTYHVRLKLAETRSADVRLRLLTVVVNGEEVASRVDIAATAGGLNRAADLVFNGLEPAGGVIAVRFLGSEGGEAIVQAIEIGPGDGGEGARAVTVPAK